MKKCSLCRAIIMILELERGRSMKLGFQRKSSKAPQTRKKNTNSKHYFEEQNTNASIGNNKVTKLFMSNDILQLKKDWIAWTLSCTSQEEGWLGMWWAGLHKGGRPAGCISQEKKEKKFGLWTNFYQCNMTKWIHGQQLVWEKHQPLSGAWLTVKRMYFKVDGVAVLEDILTWEKDPADIWNSIKLVQLPRQKIRSSINGQSAKHVNFQHCNDVLLWVMRK